MRTASVEDYLKAIYQIQAETGASPVNTTALAAHLGVACASVTGMLKKLAAQTPSLVMYEPYSGVSLTPAGEKAALEVIRHHRLLESFLVKSLGYTWDEVHEEAERLEHVISEQMEERIAAALGNPQTDPHGEPIPDREGNFQAQNTIPLSSLAPGTWGRIQRVSADNPALLRYLDAQGMVPGVKLRVSERGPFNGPYSVEIPSSPGPNRVLTRDVTDHVFISLLE
jgi:DtxR family Mn-dependent transcriptional regulator